MQGFNLDSVRQGATMTLILRCERSEPRRARVMAIDVTVYILRCADGSYYTGLTKKGIEARVWEHNNLPDEKSYTAKRRPVELVFSETYERIVDAIGRERQIKGWSRRKKEALIALGYERLPELSRRSHLISKT